MNFRVAALLLLPLVWLAGCNPAKSCDERLEDSKAADGGIYRCARAEECPRASGTFICTTDAPPDVECVTCTASTCLRHIPVECK